MRSRCAVKTLLGNVSLIALLVTGAAGTAQAQDKVFTASVLYDECTNHGVQSIERAHCNGFVYGFLVGMMTAAEIMKSDPPFCGGAPEVGELVTVFQTFVRMRTDALSKGAGAALTAAFATAFPGRKAK
jgi:hypothetical protein